MTVTSNTQLVTLTAGSLVSPLNLVPIFDSLKSAGWEQNACHPKIAEPCFYYIEGATLTLRYRHLNSIYRTHCRKKIKSLSQHKAP